MRIGTDIIENKRMSKVIASEHVFSQEEIEYCESFGPQNRIPHYAGFWATKEAVRKAFDCNINMKDICITHTENGEPKIVENNAIKNMLKKYNLSTIKISISNEKNYSCAMCLVE